MLIALLFICLVAGILLFPDISFKYASQGLVLWFERMVPCLLPFMILSSTVIRLGISEKLGTLFHPLFALLYKNSKNVSFGLVMGLLCGFPMGARVAAQLYESNRVTKKEAEFLLYISNSIGPVYFCGFAVPLLGVDNVPLLLIGMYGIPLAYGLVLRGTLYRDLSSNINVIKNNIKDIIPTQIHLENILDELNTSIHTSVESILSMGGYMILFNLLFMFPRILLKSNGVMFFPLLEITGGLVALGDKHPVYSLVMLSFGGLCCICQTYNCISKTDLSIGKYILHKTIIAFIAFAYYSLLLTL